MKTAKIQKRSPSENFPHLKREMRQQEERKKNDTSVSEDFFFSVKVQV